MQVTTQALRFFWLTNSEQFELRASGLLLSRRFRNPFLLRFGVLIVAGIVLPLFVTSQLAIIATLLFALAGECLGRWLFFVSVVGKSMAAAFTAPRRAA